MQVTKLETILILKKNLHCLLKKCRHYNMLIWPPENAGNPISADLYFKYFPRKVVSRTTDGGTPSPVHMSNPGEKFSEGGCPRYPFL